MNPLAKNDLRRGRQVILQDKVSDEVGFLFELFQELDAINTVEGQKHIVG
jgi:hypothetical protein